MHINVSFSAVACEFRGIQAVVSKVLSPVHPGAALLWLPSSSCGLVVAFLACPRTPCVVLGRVLYLALCFQAPQKGISPVVVLVNPSCSPLKADLLKAVGSLMCHEIPLARSFLFSSAWFRSWCDEGGVPEML